MKPRLKENENFSEHLEFCQNLDSVSVHGKEWNSIILLYFLIMPVIANKIKGSERFEFHG